MKGLRIVLLLAVVLLGAISWRASTGARSDQLTYYAPDEYVARADAFIRNGYLEASCRDLEPELIPHLENAPAAERSWYEESYLEADVKRFNRDPRGFAWAFALDSDCRLRGVNPAVHTIELPFHRSLRWLGSILYRGQGADATLRSAHRVITLEQPEKPITTTTAGTTRVGSSEAMLNEGSVLLHFPGGPGQPAGRVFHIGDQVVLQNRVRAGSGEETRLMGHRLQVGRWVRLETGDWLTFERTDPRRRVSETFVFEGGETQELASWVRRQNDRYDRRSDDPGLGQVPDQVRNTAYPFLDQVAKNLDRVITLLPEDEGAALAESFDLELTLERQTQLQIHREFRKFCLASGKGLDQPFSAGVTVLDGIGGDLLALATFPNQEDLEDSALSARARRRLLQNQNFVLHPIGSAVKPYLFAAVAQAFPDLLEFEIAAHPPERHHTDIFHCQIPVGYQLLPGHYQEWIGFEKALEVSCNKYTIELSTVALAAHEHRVPTTDAPSSAQGGIALDSTVPWPRPGRRSGIRLAGRELPSAPDLRGFFFFGNPVEDPESGAAVRCTNLDRLDLVDYQEPLRQITGAETYRGVIPALIPTDPTRRQLEQGYLSNRYDFGPWMPLVNHLSIGHEQDTVGLQIRTTLQEISPERVNLALNQVTRIRSDYISLLLGGGTSIWTNIQLAESMARVVTGRKVEAHLASRVLPRPKAGDNRNASDPTTDSVAETPEPVGHQLAPALDLHPEVRRRVLEGMRRVVFGDQGTAKALRDEFRTLAARFPDDTLALYSKTGSPVIEKSVPPVVGRALEKIVVRERLRLQNQVLVLTLADRTVPYAKVGSRAREAWNQALQQGLSEVGFGRSTWIRSTLRRVIDNFAEDLADGLRDLEELQHPLKIEGGKLLVDRDNGLFTRETVTGHAGIYHFALVKLPGRDRPLPPTEADLALPGARVLSVAIHLEAEAGSEQAVAAAEALFPLLEPLLH